MSEIENPAKAILVRNKSVFQWVIPICPNCGEEHWHGGGGFEENRPREFLGDRCAHCRISGAEGYQLIEDPELKNKNGYNLKDYEKIIKEIRFKVKKKPMGRRDQIKKNKLSFEEWISIGIEFKIFREKLHNLYLILNKLPKNIWEYKLRSIESKFEKLRSDLDNIVGGSFFIGKPEKDKEVNNIFYSPIEERKNI